MTMTDGAVLVASRHQAAVSISSATLAHTKKKQSPTGLHVDRTASTETTANARSPLLQSRVGRDRQRYDGCARLLACIVPVRSARDASGLQVLLISSAKHEDEWILPKGGWDSDESVQECALREADEEAGVAGAIVAELGPLDFESHRGQPCRFFGFRMDVSQVYSDWSENSRRRQWVAVEEAKRLLRRRPELLEMLTRATATGA